MNKLVFNMMQSYCTGSDAWYRIPRYFCMGYMYVLVVETNTAMCPVRSHNNNICTWIKSHIMLLIVYVWSLSPSGHFEIDSLTGKNRKNMVNIQKDIYNWWESGHYVYWQSDVRRAPVQIARFMEPTWGPPGPCRPQMCPMLASWTLLSGKASSDTMLSVGTQLPGLVRWNETKRVCPRLKWHCVCWCHSTKNSEKLQTTKICNDTSYYGW